MCSLYIRRVLVVSLSMYCLFYMFSWDKDGMSTENTSYALRVWLLCNRSPGGEEADVWWQRLSCVCLRGHRCDACSRKTFPLECLWFKIWPLGLFSRNGFSKGETTKSSKSASAFKYTIYYQCILFCDISRPYDGQIKVNIMWKYECSFNRSPIPVRHWFYPAESVIALIGCVLLDISANANGTLATPPPGHANGRSPWWQQPRHSAILCEAVWDK